LRYGSRTEFEGLYYIHHWLQYPHSFPTEWLLVGLDFHQLVFVRLVAHFRIKNGDRPRSGGRMLIRPLPHYQRKDMEVEDPLKTRMNERRSGTNPVPAAFAPLLAGQKRQSSFIEYPKTGNPSFGFESKTQSR